MLKYKRMRRQFHRIIRLTEITRSRNENNYFFTFNSKFINLKISELLSELLNILILWYAEFSRKKRKHGEKN